MGRNCSALGVSKTCQLQRRNTHPFSTIQLPSHSFLVRPDSSDSHTQTCEAKAKNADSGHHYNQLVGSSIALKLLFAVSLEVLWRKRQKQSKKRLFVSGSVLTTNWWKGETMRKTMKYVSAWPSNKQIVGLPKCCSWKIRAISTGKVTC